MAAQVLPEKFDVYYLAFKIKLKTVFFYEAMVNKRDFVIRIFFFSMKNFYFINPKV